MTFIIIESYFYSQFLSSLYSFVGTFLEAGPLLISELRDALFFSLHLDFSLADSMQVNHDCRFQPLPNCDS